MSRVERKYFVPESQLSKVQRTLSSYVRTDEHARNNGGSYTVRSIYFDTHNLRFFYEKLAGIKVRKKVRIRGYNQLEEDSPVFLEIKRKNDRSVYKDRAPIIYTDVLEYIRTGHPDLIAVKDSASAQSLKKQAERFYYQMHTLDLYPVANVIYEREPYFYKFYRGLRITLDKYIRTSPKSNIEELYSEKQTCLVHPGYFVLEIKTNKSYPKWLSHLIAQLNVRHEAISKYINSVMTLREKNIPVRRSRMTKSNENNTIKAKQKEVLL